MTILEFHPSYGDSWTATVQIPYELYYDRKNNVSRVVFDTASASYYGRPGYGTRMDCSITVTAEDTGESKTLSLTTYGYTQGQSTFYGTPNPSDISFTHSGNGVKNITVSASCTIHVYMYSGSSSQTDVSGSGSYTATSGSRYVLSISKGYGSTISVVRSGTAIYNGEYLSAGDSLVITFGTESSYSLQTHTVNGEEFESGNTFAVTGDVYIVTTATEISFRLRLSSGLYTSISVNRTASPHGASQGQLVNNAKVYAGDVLSISMYADEGCHLITHTVNDVDFESGQTHTVNGDVRVVTLGAVNVYNLVKQIGSHSSLYIERTASPLGKAPDGEVTGNSVYHGDELLIRAIPVSGYGIDVFTLNGTPIDSPQTVKATNDLTIVLVVSALGFVRIDTGSSVDKYRIFIDSGSGLEPYRVMIDTGSEIVPY